LSSPAARSWSIRIGAAGAEPGLEVPHSRVRIISRASVSSLSSRSHVSAYELAKSTGPNVARKAARIEA